MDAVASVISPVAESIRALRARVSLPDSQQRVIPLGLPEIDAALPDGGLPRGAVVEIASVQGLGQATALLLRLCASAQKEACLRGGEPAWCAWLDPSATLYAPGVASLGVALDRLLVVRPPLEAISRIAVRLVASRVFSVVVIDTVGVPGAAVATPLHRWSTVLRRLALAAEGGDSCVVLLSERAQSRSAGLPVALRVELEHCTPETLRLHVVKERRGRVSSPRELAYGSLPYAVARSPEVSIRPVAPSPSVNAPTLRCAG